METILDRTKKLAKEKGLSLSELEEKLALPKPQYIVGKVTFQRVKRYKKQPTY